MVSRAVQFRFTLVLTEEEKYENGDEEIKQESMNPDNDERK